MKKLTDFKPLHSIKLPDVGDISCQGLTLVVGPNSSGKTNLLKDVNAAFMGKPYAPVVVDVKYGTELSDNILMWAENFGDSIPNSASS